MIIRSQDKCKITDDLKLHIERRYEERFGAWYEIRTSSHESIGEYSTMEKAVKALDMICENYQNNKKCESGLRKIAETEFVFQMPQDSEV